MMIEIIDIIQCDGGISMGLATLIAGLAAAGASTGQAIGAGKMNKRAERYAREENALNRQFQAEQSQIGRDFQEEMYNKYYSPSAMMQQFKDAGVNPVLAAGQITGQGGMSSPSPAGGSSMQPNFVNPMESFAGISDSIMNISRLKAEIRNMNADSVVKETAAEGNKIDNQFKPQLYQNDLNQGKVNIVNTLAGINFAEKRLNDDLLNSAYNRALQSKQIEQIGIENFKTTVEVGLNVGRFILESNESRARVSEIKARTFEQKWINEMIEKHNVNPKYANDWFNIIFGKGENIIDSVSKGYEEINKNVKQHYEDVANGKKSSNESYLFGDFGRRYLQRMRSNGYPF